MLGAHIFSGKAPDHLCRTQQSDSPKLIRAPEHQPLEAVQGGPKCPQGDWKGKVSPKSRGTKVRRGCPSLSQAEVPGPCPPGVASHWNLPHLENKGGAAQGSFLGTGCTRVVCQDAGEWTFPRALCTCGQWPGFSSLQEELRDEAQENDAA